MAVSLLSRTDARRGRAPDGSKAHESAESSEMEQEEEAGGDPEDKEGPGALRQGSKKDFRGRQTPGRKRNIPGSKNTKAPMDSDCGCGGSKKKGGCGCSGKKDGDTSRGPGELYNSPVSSTRRMNSRDSSCGTRRGDSLNVHEYLDACDLGIQNEPNSYIRARLDASERFDLKCGNGAIRQGQKCHKGTATTVRNVVGGGALALGAAAGAVALARNPGAVTRMRRVATVAAGRAGQAGAKAASQGATMARSAGSAIATQAGRAQRRAPRLARVVAGRAVQAGDYALSRGSSMAATAQYVGSATARRVSRRASRLTRVAAGRATQAGEYALSRGASMLESASYRKRSRDSVWAEGFDQIDAFPGMSSGGSSMSRSSFPGRRVGAGTR